MRMCLSTRCPFSAFSVLESSSPMMRSESRTDDTSGLVTMTATSANRIASVAPRSIPAGLSQITQSNFPRSSLMTSATPSSVSASLSRVCDAGSNHSVSRRLSRMSACDSFATPWMTLTRSKTTRRSAPITRSRLRSPTSKSTTATFCPACASAAPSAAVDVVLPTPPLPDVTTRTLAIPYLLCRLIQRCNFHDIAFKPRLGRPITQRGAYVFRGLVVAVDRQQLCFDSLTENPRGRIAVDTRHRSAAKRSVDMDRTTGDDLRAGTDRTQHGHIALGKNNRLTGAHRAVEQQRS